jgi:hypothetical protein
VTHQRLKDSDGRLIPTVIAEHISDQAQEDMAATARLDENKVLGFIWTHKDASYASIAVFMDWKLYSGKPHKMKAKRCVDSLIKAKLIKSTRVGNYRVTPEGKKVLGVDDGEE